MDRCGHMSRQRGAADIAAVLLAFALMCGVVYWVVTVYAAAPSSRGSLPPSSAAPLAAAPSSPIAR